MFRENYAAVRRYALRRAPGDAAQDIVAETFLVAWRRLEDVPGDSLPWLYGVARRVLANQRRAEGRGDALQRRLGATADRAGSEDIGDRLGDAETVRTALSRLSEQHREALMLVAWDGMTGARAASAAGCTRGAFGVRLHRARARLAAELRALEPTAMVPEARSVEAP